MTYIYTEVNRLDAPHNYMYTKFEGYSLIQSYLDDRMSALNRVSIVSDHEKVTYVTFDSFLEAYYTKALKQWPVSAGVRFLELQQHSNKQIMLKSDKPNDSKILNFANSLPSYTDAEPIKTMELLQAVIASQLTDSSGVKVKEWLDSVLQRFEVTKKIYEVYPKGFRKGEGSSALVVLYWLLALSLSLYYIKNKSIKYLSALLKVCDLLFSLPDKIVFGQISKQAMVNILSTEILSIEMLAQDKVNVNEV